MSLSINNKNTMQKKVSKPRLLIRTSAALGLGLLLIATAYPGDKTVQAEASCSSISDCTNQINANRAAVTDLKNQAVSYKDAVSRLQSQIDIVQAQIADSKRQQADLEKQINDAQAQLDYQKSVLSEILRTMYIDGQISTIEALATSNNLSEYVDKEEYRRQVTNQIKDTLKTIADLQATLQVQKAQVNSLLAQQQSQSSQLANDQTQQSELLAYNQSQQASFNAQTAANQSKLNALIAAQRTANTSSSGGYYFLRFEGNTHAFNPSSYPYANAGFSMSTAPGCNDNDGPDKWLYCTRQCVSYVAWAVEASGRQAPTGWGDAKKWVARAKAAGVPVYNTPAPGDVAISTAGTWGHAMYVESVSDDKIYVSQYNQQLNGQLSTQWREWQ